MACEENFTPKEDYYLVWACKKKTDGCTSEER